MSVTIPHQGLSPDPDVDLSRLLGHLPALPSILRYHDKSQDKYRIVSDYPKWTAITINAGGRRRTHDFGHFNKDLVCILRHVVADLFSKIDASTASTYLESLKSAQQTQDCIIKSVTLSIAEFRSWWIEHCSTKLSVRRSVALKAMLHSFCRQVIGPWSTDYHEFVSSLPSPTKNRYTVVDAGHCFLPVEHQAKITNWLDDLAAEVAADPGSVDEKRLREACSVTLSHQLGLRPIQMAEIKIDDVSFREDRVYVRVLVAKQPDGMVKYATRRLKPEWVVLWIEFARRRPTIAPAPQAHSDSFLGRTPERVSEEVRRAVERITGKNWSPIDLRHTGAQRLADAGASHAEIQDFLMHSTDGAALVYFSGSAAQASKVNDAMGLSQLYKGVASIARLGMIDRKTLERFPSDQQIGGVPHGIPVAGIGACKLGQSHCIKNPVLSCYGCRSFMPLNEPAIHREVADGLRTVVRQFLDVASDVDASPAYGQLRHTIEAADRAAADADASSLL
jgi:site-specific recombinase XerD